jgi:hypothetical protein
MKLSIPKFSRSVATFGDWTLYKTQAQGYESFLWQNFRLQLPVDTPMRRGLKRIYYLVWNPLALRFARSESVFLLKENHPGMAFDLEMHMGIAYDRAWLLDPEGEGVTEAEIEAELARLGAAKAAARRDGLSVLSRREQRAAWRKAEDQTKAALDSSGPTVVK